MIDLSTVPIESSPPPLDDPIDDQVACLLTKMHPHEAVVLPAAVAYLALIKALGMGVSVALALVEGSETMLRLYKLSPFPRAFVG